MPSEQTGSQHGPGGIAGILASMVALGVLLFVVGASSLDGQYAELARKLTILGGGMIVVAGGLAVVIEKAIGRFGPNSEEGDDAD